MDVKKAFGIALKKIRKSKGFTQEDFSTISSRTYLSTLERGVKSPTLEKIEQLCLQMGVHPLTLIAATYHEKDRMSSEEIINAIRLVFDDVFPSDVTQKR